MVARFRHCLTIVLAVCMAASLLHGPSMALAGALAASHLSPHVANAHHSSAADENHASHHATAPEQPCSPSHDGHGANALPQCPLANVAAITPVAPLSTVERASVMLDAALQSAPLSADIDALDPPPRLLS